MCMQNPIPVGISIGAAPCAAKTRSISATSSPSAGRLGATTFGKLRIVALFDIGVTEAMPGRA